MTEYRIESPNFDLEKIATEKAEKALRATLLRVSQNVIVKTPVLDGYLINNWRPSLNAIDETTTEQKDKTGNRSRQRAEKVVTQFSVGDTFHFQNSLPYAHRIEYEGYSSVKAPAGMVRVSLASFGTIFEQELSSL